ncbi:MAG: hypothetical protein M3O35_04570 [Acidobacteriota bacterium]|jgi:hypothetical protein|nr:hypothetical protein [Acidobacteriota bacterium]
MNGVLAKTVIGTSALLFAAGAFAQGYERERGYGRERGYERGYGGSPVERAMYDLNQVSSYGYRNRGDMRRINKAREELREFESKLARGRFDKGELDDAIGAIQHVVNSNWISPRDASVLQEDLYRLREFREQSRYGYRR